MKPLLLILFLRENIPSPPSKIIPNFKPLTLVNHLQIALAFCLFVTHETTPNGSLYSVRHPKIGIF